MSVATKTAAVPLATTALCGIGSLAAAAYADTPVSAASHASARADASSDASGDSGSQVGKAQYSRGFRITNLSGSAASVARVDGNTSFEGRPADGAVLQPGIGSDDWEVTYFFAKDTTSIVTYTLADAAGKQPGDVVVRLSVDGVGNPSASCLNTDGPFSCNANGTNITILDPAGTVHTIAGDNAQAQAATLKQFCDQNTAAQCTFTPTSETQVDGPEHVLVTEENNGQSPAVLTASKGDTVSSSNSLEIDGTVGVNLLGIVNASVTAKYGHTWADSHTFTTGVSNNVPAGYFGEITAIAPMIRDTGNFTITMGDTTWNLTGVYFDAPNPDGAEHFGYQEHPLTPAQQATLPTTAIVTTK